MSDSSESTRLGGLEYFKAFSTFFSSVVIALTGIYLTANYNSQQLEIAQQQAQSQLELAKLQEIAKIVPKLGSKDQSERQFGAIALGLYGSDAVPPLLALLNDPSGDVRTASIESLALIGKIAAPQLVEALLNKRNPTNLRSGAIYALGQMQFADSFALAIDILNNQSENPTVRKDAAAALGFLRDGRAVQALMDRLNEAKSSDEDLAANIIWSLQQIADPRATGALKTIIFAENETLQIGAIWALAECSPAEAQATLSQLSSDESRTEKVRSIAAAAVAYARKRASPDQTVKLQ